MNIVNNYSSTIVTIYQDVVKNYEHNMEKIKCIEDELNDLNHEAEFSKPKDMFSGYKIYKQIRDLRIERRRMKEENELLKDMYDFFTGQHTQQCRLQIGMAWHFLL